MGKAGRAGKFRPVVLALLASLPPRMPHRDTARGSIGDLTLTRDWNRPQIDLAGKDLSQIKTGFAWVVPAGPVPITFFLDEIRFE